MVFRYYFLPPDSIQADGGAQDWERKHSNAGSCVATGSCVTQKNQLPSLGLGFPRSQERELDEVLPAPAGLLWNARSVLFLQQWAWVGVWPFISWSLSGQCVFFLRRQLRVYCEALKPKQNLLVLVLQPMQAGIPELRMTAQNR